MVLQLYMYHVAPAEDVSALFLLNDKQISVNAKNLSFANIAEEFLPMLKALSLFINAARFSENYNIKRLSFSDNLFLCF